MKIKPIYFFILLALLIISLCMQYCKKGQQSSFSEETYKNNLAKEHKISEDAFVKIKQLEAHVDTLEEEIKDSEKKRDEINSEWTPAITKAKAKCDTTIINVLDSLHHSSVAQCDTTIKKLFAEVKDQKEISAQKDTVIASRDRTIDLMGDKILDQEETIKKGKRKAFWVKAGAVGVIIVAILVKTSQAVKK